METMLEGEKYRENYQGVNNDTQIVDNSNNNKWTKLRLVLWKLRIEIIGGWGGVCIAANCQPSTGKRAHDDDGLTTAHSLCIKTLNVECFYTAYQNKRRILKSNI